MTDDSLAWADAADLTHDQIRGAVLRFLDGCAVDTIPQNAAEVGRFAEFLPAGRRVYVGQLPGTALEQIIDLVGRLSGMGYRPIPQFAAREVSGEAQLRGALERLQAFDVTEALIVAGDRSEPAGPYHSTLALLGTGMLAAHGITTVGVAGYPEGNRLIGPTALAQALAAKLELAEACAWKPYIVTQLSFDPQTVVAWIERDARRGITLPVHVGLPGLGSLRDLIGYSRRCGVGASMRALVAKASSLPDSTALGTTSDLVLAYACWLARRPELRGVRARFFTFAGLEQTARWIERVRGGHFQVTGSDESLTLETRGE